MIINVDLDTQTIGDSVRDRFITTSGKYDLTSKNEHGELIITTLTDTPNCSRRTMKTEPGKTLV
jgi:hypothetical protein